LRLFDRRPAAIGAYALGALLAGFELTVLWQALHPNVSDDYRAYYIDRTTTCLPQLVTGAYELGTIIDFRAGGDETRELRPCGWTGPYETGLHSVGQSSRLRFHIGAPQDLLLTLELTGVTLPGPPQQRVLVSAGDLALGQWLVTPDRTENFTLAIPAAAIDAEGYLDLLLDYPDAISPGRVANTYWRSVKLTAGRLAPQT
jgi:hypothetical protein